MTSSQKQDIYNFLKAADSCIAGYIDESYKNSIPLFKDDKILNGEEPSVKNSGTAKLTMDSIIQKVQNCHNCTLCQSRTNVVPGEGVKNPYVLVVGEGPGEDEDRTGRPFVGKAGVLLDKMLAAISLDRECNCYIANIVKCRPPRNRVPFPQEAEACKGYLQSQIHILKPKMILAMGRTAIQNLYGTSEGITTLRGRMLDYHGIPLMATYHPSALLRDQRLKIPAWADLKAFRSTLQQIAPEYAQSFNQKHL